MQAIDLLVLGLIAEKPRHGYDIARQVDARGLRDWIRVSDVAAYKACARLEGQGCLASVTERPGKGPQRSVYRLTATGRERLSDLLYEQLSSPEPLRNEFCLALEFPESLDVGETLLALERRAESVSRRMAGWAARLESLSGLVGGLAEKLAASICRRQIEVYRGELAWLEELASLLEDGRGGAPS